MTLADGIHFTKRMLELEPTWWSGQSSAVRDRLGPLLALEILRLCRLGHLGTAVNVNGRDNLAGLIFVVEVLIHQREAAAHAVGPAIGQHEPLADHGGLEGRANHGVVRVDVHDAATSARLATNKLTYCAEMVAGYVHEALDLMTDLERRRELVVQRQGGAALGAPGRCCAIIKVALQAVDVLEPLRQQLLTHLSRVGIGHVEMVCVGADALVHRKTSLVPSDRPCNAAPTRPVAGIGHRLRVVWQDLHMSDRTPAQGREAFQCPHCGVFAKQSWGAVNFALDRWGHYQVEGMSACRCDACSGECIWRDEDLIFPLARLGEPAHEDTPRNVLDIYEEARSVAPISKKSAAGLLRLALQMLIDDLEPGNATIDKKIGALVKRGLDPQVQKAMDSLRVIGNESVHPGMMDLDADPDLLDALFRLTNVIVEQVITRPKHIDSIFSKLPAAKRQAIERRDGS